MRTLLNIIWFLLGGLWLAVGYVVFGIIACALIVTIPFGIASFRMASYAIWPFGRAVVRKRNAGVVTGLGNLLWFAIGGLWLSIGHVITAIVQAVTIIGIPLAIANLKMIPVTCFPFGKEIVSSKSLHERALHSF